MDVDAGPASTVQPALGLFGSSRATYEWVGSGGVTPGGNDHASAKSPIKVTVLVGVHVSVPNTLTFDPLMFFGRRRPITTGKLAGVVSEAAIVTVVATFATGAVTFEKYPPPNGPTVTELEPVVLVVNTPLAVALCAGAGVWGANTTVLPLHAHSTATMTNAPRPARTKAVRIETGRMAQP